MNGRVSCVKLSRASYAALAHKDVDTLYFVNIDGNFDEQNMDDAEVYLGGKLLGIDPADLEAMLQGVGSVDGNVYAFGGVSNTTSYQYDIPLAPFQGAAFFDLNLHTTIQNLGQSYVNVEIWMEMGYYEKNEKEELVWHTSEHIAATQVFLPVYALDRGQSVCSANIAGQLVGPFPSSPAPYLKVCFSATDPVTICSVTPMNNLPKATVLTVRSWTPVLPA